MLLLLLPLLAGILARSAGGVGALFAGSVLVGIGIAIGNVLVPAFVRLRFPDRLALMMGIYVSLLQVSGAVGSALTVPLEDGLGWGWRSALAVWAAPVAVLVLLWCYIVWRGAPPAATRPPSGLAHVARRRLTWAVTAFMAIQAAIFYTLLTWIPAHLTSQGISPATAGLALASFGLIGLPGAFIGPRLATGPHARAFVLGVYALNVVAVPALGLGPGVAMVAVLVAGLCQGAGFSIALTFIADQPDGHDVPAVSAMAQGLGYLAAAIGPTAIGALHGATGTWFWPDLFVVAALVCAALIGQAVGARIHRGHALERLGR